ncbi:sodium:solute symporter family transporter [Streptomyces gilvus]|uniref:sodium:solute symporter family transporter n=1 Tax=Streptomyces gilvus TaxID=2920937 RepID=UPI001F0D5B18|nr:transporter [Streptomyces sp. CME 23]MCH5675559.1 transporter [Streptomyces sp. CME 23]
MTVDILSSAVLDPVGPDARRPVIIAFMIIIGLSLLWLFTLAAVEENTPEKLYLANRSLSPLFNGFAMAGEQISVVALFTLSGGIALFGYDGVIYAMDCLFGLAVLLLLAQKMHNSGCYTLGDLFSMRASGTAPRIAATMVTLAVSMPLLIVQLRAAGISAAVLIGRPTDGVEVLCTVLIGCLIACFAAVAGLRGNSFLHVVKVPITVVTLAAVSLLAVRRFDWDPGSLLSAAVEKSVKPDGYLKPGLWPRVPHLGAVDLVGAHVVAVLGLALVPHMILRISASQSGQAARRSLSIASGLIALFVLLLITAGFAAAAVLGGANILAVDASGEAAQIQLASSVLSDGSQGRVAIIVVVACVVFLAVLSTVTSATFAAAVSCAHDVFASGKDRTEPEEMRALRVAAVVMGVVGLSAAAALHRYPTQFLASLSLNVAASCIFPVLIYSFFWRRFNRRGLLLSVHGGLSLCAILTILSPTVSGTRMALFPDAHFNWYPFVSPGLVALPATFFLGWLGSVTSRDDHELDFRLVEYRLLTGKEPGRESART